MPIPFNPVASDETRGGRLPVFAVTPGPLLDPNERRIVLNLGKHDPDVRAPRILLLSVVLRISGGQGLVGSSPQCKGWLIECRFCHVRRCRTARIWFPGEVLMSGTMSDKTPSGESQSRCVISTGYAAISNFIGVLSGFRLSPPWQGEPPGNRPGFARPARLGSEHGCRPATRPYGTAPAPRCGHSPNGAPAGKGVATATPTPPSGTSGLGHPGVRPARSRPPRPA